MIPKPAFEVAYRGSHFGLARTRFLYVFPSAPFNRVCIDFIATLSS